MAIVDATPSSVVAANLRLERKRFNAMERLSERRVTSNLMRGVGDKVSGPDQLQPQSAEANLDPLSVVILIADDEEIIRSVLREAFEDGGFSVVLAQDGEEAIGLLDANRGVRALVTDIKLGSDVTGWDVARHGREINPDLPVVYVTGSESQDWASLGVPNSILIAKPFASAQVLTAVSQLLNIGSTPSA